MPTTKQRINITTSHEMESALKLAAKRDKIPVAAKASNLLRLALEIEEDAYLGIVANERAETNRSKFLSHDKAWK